MFTESFKYYKSKCPPPDLNSVIDFDIKNEACASKVELKHAETQSKFPGVVSPADWRVYEVTDRPGLLYIRNPFTLRGQRYWIARCLRDFPKAPHAVNLNPKLFSKDAIDDWWTQLQQTPLQSRDRQVLKNGMRWATLGYHHNWDTKVYAEDKRHQFPNDLGQLCKYISTVLGFPGEYSAEAAIVNFYPLGSTLAGHTDHSEKNLSAPLFSFSFGQTAIFLLGGKTKAEKPSAIFLKSGDIVVMSKESRLSYHAVPKILATDVRSINSSENFSSNDECVVDASELDDDETSHKKRKLLDNDFDNPLQSAVWSDCAVDKFWQPFGQYITDCRININVRQVLHCGEATL